MAAVFSPVGAVSSTAFFGAKVKKAGSLPMAVPVPVPVPGRSSFRVQAAQEQNLDEKRNSDKWSGLAYDISDDQQDITRGKGLVDSVFQAPLGDGTHIPVLQSFEYVSQGLRQYASPLLSSLCSLHLPPFSILLPSLAC